MKITSLSALFLGLGMFAGHAAAGEMQCYVDTPALDQFNPGGCFAVGYDRTTSAVFKVFVSKQISQVLWNGDASGQCSGAGSICAIDISHFQPKTVGATVLFTDGTWESISAITAHYEGFY